MKILYDPKLLSDLSGKFIFVDTNIFISVLNFPEEMGQLFKELKSADCSLITIPQVLFEFTRGSDNLDLFNKRQKFIQDLASIYPIERHFEEERAAVIVLQRILGSSSYTDFLLSLALCKFSDSYVISENHKDFPLQIFNREFVITVDTDKEIRNYGLYKLSQEKFEREAAKLL